MKARGLGAFGLALLLAACSGNQDALNPKADQAEAISHIFTLMMWVCGFMYLLVLIFLGWAIWRARRRLGHDLASSGAHEGPDEPKLSRTLAGWTALIVAGLFVLTTGSFLVDRSLASAAGPPLRIKATANQWWWNLEYQDGADSSQNFTTANELHIPVNRTAEITLQSNDVIHSFWVPNLHGKTDLIPGRTNKILLTPRHVGVYRGQCAEYCGLQHAHMAFQVYVDSPAAYAAWRANQVNPAASPPPATTAEQGGQVFATSACSACHQIRGTDAGGHFGPDLTHVASRRTIAAGTLPFSRGSLGAWISDPQRVKPGTNMPSVDLSPDQLNAVVDYLSTLK